MRSAFLLLTLGACSASAPPASSPSPAPLLGADLDALGQTLASALPASCTPAATFAPERISTPLDEGRAVLSSDGDTLYFHQTAADKRQRLMVATRDGAGWSAPTVLPFSGRFDDLDAFLTLDGSTLYFASFRPDSGETPRADADLFRVIRRADGSWGTPERLGAAVNSSANELFPSLTRDGTLWFNSDRPGSAGEWDIYRAAPLAGGFAAAENLGPPINSDVWEYNPTPTPDGRVMFFGSLDRPGGLGKSDVWLASRDSADPSATWRVINPGPCVNSAAAEYHPAWAAPLGGITFIRNQDQGGDVFSLTVLR